MKKPAVILLLLGTLVYLVSLWTNLDYVWGGIRECWLRGWENAQIDDMVYRDHLRELPASTDGDMKSVGAFRARCFLGAPAPS